MMAEMMKALVVREFGGPEVLRIDEVPRPSPGKDQLLVRVHAVGVNPVDSYIRSGTYARTPELPYVPGTDLGGVVEETGAEVTGVAAGERVYAFATTGACAEWSVCETWQLRPLPAGVSFEQGAALGVPYGTAWRALFLRARVRPGETVLVHGASGGVGGAAVQLARAHGMRVIGTAGSPRGLDVVREQGAHHVLNHREPDYLREIGPLTGGRGVDVVLEMLANVNLDADLDVLAQGGRVAVIGNRGRVEIDPRKAMRSEAAILGVMLARTTREEFREIHAGVGAGLENGTIRPVVDRAFPLEEAAAAHAAVIEDASAGKIVLTV
jgi:NADPH:quinone reductase